MLLRKSWNLWRCWLAPARWFCFDGGRGAGGSLMAMAVIMRLGVVQGGWADVEVLHNDVGSICSSSGT